jgi:hypothetical protein
MNVNSLGWNQDIYTWKFTREKGIVEDKNGYSTGYLVLQYMSTWKSPESTKIYTDDRTMCQNFIIEVLSLDAKCYRKLLPANVKDYLSRNIGRDIN